MLKLFHQVHQHVQRRKLVQVEGRVTVEHFVIETQDVEAHYKVGALQVGEQFVDLALAVNAVLVARSAVSHTDAHAHSTDFAPTAHLVGGLLRFEVEINYVLRHASLPIKPSSWQQTNAIFAAKLNLCCLLRGKPVIKRGSSNENRRVRSNSAATD